MVFMNKKTHKKTSEIIAGFILLEPAAHCLILTV